MARVNIISQGLLADRPAAGVINRFWRTTDPGAVRIYQDNGTSWDLVAVVDWDDLEGKPSTFTPSLHEHSGDSALGYVDLIEQAGVTSPAADRLRLYPLDVGGKTALEARDAGGGLTRIPRDDVVICQNTSGGALNAGAVVRATGLSGTDIPTIGLASASASSTMPSIGYTMESIANNAYGRVMLAGVLTGVSTTGMTAGQTLYVGTTSGTFTNVAPENPNYRQVLGMVLSVGASGVILVNTAAYWVQAPAATTVPSFSAYLSTDQLNITDLTPTKITLNAEEFDTESGFSTTTNDYTIPTALGGKWMFGGAMRVTNPADRRAEVRLYKGGNLLKTLGRDKGGAGTTDLQPGGSALVNVAAGDVLDMRAWLDVGANTHDIVSGASNTYFWGYRVSA